MTQTGTHQSTLRLIFAFALAKLVVHFVANHNYGIHGDELYYIALSRHLQWGYLDNSPLIAFVAKISSWCFGESVFAWRVIPTLFSAFTVGLVGIIARDLGGKRFAISVACLGTICSPALLATSYFLQPVAFDVFLWTLLSYLIVKFIKSEKQLYLYGAAFTVGLGILNKYTILLYVIALLVGLLLTSQRRLIKPINLLKAFAIALLVSTPNLIWQFMHHFPILNYLGLVGKHSMYPGAAELLFQLTFFHGAGMAVWLAGLSYLIFDRQDISKYRFLAFAFLLIVAVLILLHGKIYYSLGAFPALFAVGGVCWENMMQRFKHIPQALLIGLITATSLIALPVVLPVLPFGKTKAYIQLMRRYTTLTQPFQWDDGKLHSLPQFYADMLGWQELADKTASACKQLTNNELNQSVILTDAYAVAGALTFYLPAHYPEIISADNSLALWSPKNLDHQKVIYLSKESIISVSALAENVKWIGTVNNPDASVQGMNIYLLYRPNIVIKKRYQAARKKFLGESVD
ncbi:glycosyltransferase family 39 protein [Mucilaginibacter sp. CSA2-8R]|uniref:ArnT family glycosyltransferase n=1 Tax=Mucilaginibacter sp. CSA2-8R TaxID=3141542 RepID=UPI00315DFED0